MHAKFGETSETDTAFKFNEIDVNFADFLAAETQFAQFGYVAAGVTALGSLLMLGWILEVGEGGEDREVSLCWVEQDTIGV